MPNVGNVVKHLRNMKAITASPFVENARLQEQGKMKMTDKPMTVGELREAIKDCLDDMPIEFSCSCSRKGGYDGWKAEIEPRDGYVNFYLNGYHDYSDWGA